MWKKIMQLNTIAYKKLKITKLIITIIKKPIKKIKIVMKIINSKSSIFSNKPRLPDLAGH